MKGILELLRAAGKEIHLIFNIAARQTISAETKWSIVKVDALADACYEPRQIEACIASGSFMTEGKLVGR